MGFLKGKKILITGILNEKSIAFGIAKAMYTQGAEIGIVCQNKKISKKVKHVISDFNISFNLFCDVSNDQEIKKLFLTLSKIWNKFDGLVHSIAFCSKEQLRGDFIKNTTRERFNLCHEISSYSFLGMVKECRNMLNPSSSLLTLSYLGSQRIIPNYNLMGLAKASLEANVRYMAYSLGKDDIRVNCISFSPIKTLSSYQIQDFNKFKKIYDSSSLIKKRITSENIGNVASFLCSDLSDGITGSIIYVDNGFNISYTNLI